VAAPSPTTVPVTTFLFTDIEGSTRLWEQAPDAMRPALARHDAIVRDAVVAHRGVIVKSTGDGVHAAFDDPLDAVRASLSLQRALCAPDATGAIAFRVRCGLHVGRDERRDNDFYGTAVNRAARIMSAAHGGQMLASSALAGLVAARLPEGVELRDLGQVRLRDLADPERLFQIVHADLRGDFPPLRSLEATPNNLPQQLTSFIGRARELAEVRSQLASTRLLTLLGIGGLGKSRLSLQVAAVVLDDFPDGVWFVELAPVVDPRLVPQVLASLLGVREEAGGTVLGALVKYVRDRCMLVILDNCEHLTQACAELARALLEAGPRVKMLASSREHLNLRGETTYPLAPLALPDAAARVPLATLLQGEAVRLFVERATAALPAFTVTERNAGAVATICQRLDGIPLALELAAARVRTLSVENIAQRLRDRFRLLSGGDRTALPRQQTLRALIDWSFDLLTEPERTLFRRLSVFAGGFTLEAAEAAGAGEEVATLDILDLLARLVEKSLVAMEPGGARYRMLETVRQYAQEKLDVASDAAATHARHLAFYCAFAESARAELAGPAQGQWLGRVDRELENVLAAHRWCDRAADGGALGLQLVTALKFYWINRGYFALGQQVTVEALARPGASAHDLARCRGLLLAGQLCLFTGRFDEAGRFLRESLDIAREQEAKAAVTAVLAPLAIASIRQGELVTARRYLDESLALARELDNKRQLAVALNELAQLDRLEGHREAAAGRYEEVLALARELDDRESIAVGLLNLAMLALTANAQERAEAMLREVHAIVVEIGSKTTGQTLLDVAGALSASRDDAPRAARLLGAAAALADDTGLHRHPADEAFLLPYIGRASQRLAPETWAAHETQGRALDFAAAMQEVDASLVAPPGAARERSG
jgi:predicted ATPase/class 3 adenylate cyclase